MCVCVHVTLCVHVMRMHVCITASALWFDTHWYLLLVLVYTLYSQLFTPTSRAY